MSESEGEAAIETTVKVLGKDVRVQVPRAEGR